jgi:hypothetical protein
MKKKSLLYALLLSVALLLSGCHGPIKNIKSVYIGSHYNATEILKLLKNYDANAVVIDVKNDLGELTFDMNVPNKILSPKKIPDIKSLLATLKRRGIYTVARIVAFKDMVRTDLHVKNKDGSSWVDREKQTWLEQNNKATWEYIKNIGEEAAKFGFDEIQLDYLRFSSYSKTTHQNLSRIETINKFLDYFCDRMHKLGIPVSVCVFGCTIEGTVDTETETGMTAKSSAIIGQDYVEIAKRVDYICPMIYPSHYPSGTPIGIQYPDLEPYKVAYATMQKSEKMLENEPKSAIVRPYLQAFTATWLKPHQAYTQKQIQEQIKAIKDAKLVQYGLFNFTINYP